MRFSSGLTKTKLVMLIGMPRRNLVFEISDKMGVPILVGMDGGQGFGPPLKRVVLTGRAHPPIILS